MRKLRLIVPTAFAVASAFALSASTASAAGVCSPSTPQYCPAPSASTIAASSVTNTSATLNGVANPQGASTACTFAYGTTTNYGQTTPLQSIGSGTSSVGISWTITGLSPNTLYHFQLVCVNGAGAFGFGGDLTFRTLSTSTTSSIALSIGSTISVSKKGILKIRIRCTSSVPCGGTLGLKALGGKKLANPKSYSIRGGGSKLISLKMTKSGLKKLRSHKRHRMKARVTAKVNGGTTRSKVVTLVLKR